MGMLGAMMGVGKGLQDYSTLLNHKADQDWTAQQAAIRYEREKNLEQLRVQGQMEVVRMNNETSRANVRDTNQTTLTVTDKKIGGDITVAGMNNDTSRDVAAGNNATSLGVARIGAISADNVANIQGRTAREVEQMRGENHLSAIGEEGKVRERLLDKQSDLTKQEIEERGRIADKYDALKMDREFVDRVALIDKQMHADVMKIDKEMRAKGTYAQELRDKQADIFKAEMEKDGTPMSVSENLIYTAYKTGVPPKDLMRESGISADMLGKIDTVLSTDEKYTGGSAAEKLRMIQQANSVLNGKSDSEPLGRITKPEDIVKFATDLNAGNPDAKRDFMLVDMGTKATIQATQQALKGKTGSPEKAQDVATSWVTPSAPVVDPNLNAAYMRGGVLNGPLSTMPDRVPYNHPISDARERQLQYMSRQKSQLQ